MTRYTAGADVDWLVWQTMLAEEDVVKEIAELHRMRLKLATMLAQRKEWNSPQRLAVGRVLGQLARKGILFRDDTDVVLARRPPFVLGENENEQLPESDGPAEDGEAETG